MMERDNTLEQLFRDYRPELSDSAQFMHRLRRQMEAVEYIRQMQEHQVRQYRRAVLAAFVLGLVSGGLLFAVVLSLPDTQPLFTFHTQWLPLLMLAEHSRLLSLVTLALLLSFGTIAFLNTLQETSTLPTRHTTAVEQPVTLPRSWLAPREAATGARPQGC